MASRLVFRQQDFQLPGIIMFGRYQYAASQSGLHPHSHRNAIEICFLERGEQSYRVLGRIHRLRGGDQFFTLPGELHDSANLPQERGILYWLILNLKASKGFLGLSESFATRLKRELRCMPTRHFLADQNCASILGQMIGLLSGKQKRPAKLGPDRQLRLQALLLQYLTITVEASRLGAQGAASPLMQRVVEYIEIHLNDPVHVPQLADVAQLSESRFKTRFKHEIGVPPAEFWLRKKIEKATDLLKSRSVTQVAYDLGFSSSQYFATAFRRYTLTHPSRFRAPGMKS